ncbi:probable nucleoside diphosphate kinase 5 isoform X1 [Tanacetum coccineum]
MVLEKTNAIADWCALIGPTDSRKAKVSHPDSIRAMCGQDLERNCIHGSDSHDSAAMEISFFFTDAFPGAHLNPVIVPSYRVDIHVSEYITRTDIYRLPNHLTYGFITSICLTRGDGGQFSKGELILGRDLCRQPFPCILQRCSSMHDQNA